MFSMKDFKNLSSGTHAAWGLKQGTAVFGSIRRRRRELVRCSMHLLKARMILVSTSTWIHCEKPKATAFSDHRFWMSFLFCYTTMAHHSFDRRDCIILLRDILDVKRNVTNKESTEPWPRGTSHWFCAELFFASQKFTKYRKLCFFQHNDPSFRHSIKKSTSPSALIARAHCSHTARLFPQMKIKKIVLFGACQSFVKARRVAN